MYIHTYFVHTYNTYIGVKPFSNLNLFAATCITDENLVIFDELDMPLFENFVLKQSTL